MFLAKDWEMLYTDSHKSSEEEYSVDQISIDKVNKRYILDMDANDLVTDGYDGECFKFVTDVEFMTLVERLKNGDYNILSCAEEYYYAEINDL